MLDEQPRIVHFSGHGDDAGLVIEDAAGNAMVVSPEALEGLFNLFSENLECVLLNACYSEVQARAIAKRIPFVIGMTQGIADDVAVEFAIGFYDALGAGKSVKTAFEFGCNAIELLGRPDGPKPILHARFVEQWDDKASVSVDRVYRFRAECEADVDKLRQILGTMIDRITIINSPPFPDVEVEIEVRLSIEELREAMRKVVDGHVMVQTVAPRDDYTGERNYDL